MRGKVRSEGVRSRKQEGLQRLIGILTTVRYVMVLGPATPQDQEKSCVLPSNLEDSREASNPPIWATEWPLYGAVEGCGHLSAWKRHSATQLRYMFVCNSCLIIYATTVTVENIEINLSNKLSVQRQVLRWVTT